MTPHDEVVIRELLSNGLNLARVFEIYKDRLSKNDIVVVARKLLIEMGPKQDAEKDISETAEKASANRNQHFCDIGIDILRHFPSDLLSESQLLKYHIANLSQSAPEDFFDPIFSHIMRDPVVISSGFIVDRSTAIKEDSGRLQFPTCPWSREPLDPNVYPALRLKQQLTEFKSDRVREMIETATLLLNVKNERYFCEVIELAHDFVEDIGPKGHPKLVFQFAKLGLCTLDLTSSDNSKLCILEPSLLTKLLLMMHGLESSDFSDFWLGKVSKMTEIVQKAIDAKCFDEADKWLGCCEELQDQCRDVLMNDKEILVARMRLDLAKKCGDKNLVLWQRNVYLKLLKYEDTEAAKKFLESEDVSAMDLRDLSPCFFGMKDLSSSIMNDAWHEGCRSSNLEGEVSHIVVTAINFHDQNWGNRKGRLGLALYTSDDELIARCNLFGTYRSVSYAFGDDAFRLLDVNEEVVSKCTPGCYYKMEFVVGGGGGHSVHAESFTCKIFYKQWFSEGSNGCYRMLDPEGDAGVFLGKVNRQGVAHGKGRLEYDDGITFVGTYANGLMWEGTNYRNGRAVHTMLEGTWTPGSYLQNPDAAVVERYPLDSRDITESEE